MIYIILFFAVLPAQYFLGWPGLMAAVMILSAGKRLVPVKAALVSMLATFAVTIFRDYENGFRASGKLSAIFGLSGHILPYVLTLVIAFVCGFLTVKAATTTFPKRKSAATRTI